MSPQKESGDGDLSESETWSLHEDEVTVRPVAYKTAKGKPCASSESDCQGGPKAERKEWSHNLHVSLDDQGVNMAIWGIFLNTTLRAAVHLGHDYEAIREESLLEQSGTIIQRN